MADKKYGRVVAIDQVQDDTRIIQVQLEEPSTIEFVGGQYVILHSEAEIEPGKPAKGTFTLISPETQTDSFTIAVKQIGDGKCTTWLNRTLQVGDRLGYSGPWGAKNFQQAVGAVDSLFVATDTGINAAIGFLNSQNAVACLPHARVWWLIPSPDYFLKVDYVRNALPEQVRERFQVAYLDQAGEANRVDQALQLLDAELSQLQPRYTLLSGDGTVLAAIQQLLTKRGFGAGITVEPYFNKPEKNTDVKKNFAPDSPPAPVPPPPPKLLPRSS